MSRPLTFIVPPTGLLTLPKRFAGAEFDERSSGALREIGTEFVSNFAIYYHDGIGPAFLGRPGVGKTYAAAAIALKLFKSGVPCYWSDVVADLNKLLEWRDFKKVDEYYKLKKNIVSTPFVVLDDFTYLATFQKSRELFFELLNARYAAKLPTLITGNFTSDEDGPWNSITSGFGGAVARRIKLMSSGLVFSE